MKTDIRTLNDAGNAAKDAAATLHTLCLTLIQEREEEARYSARMEAEAEGLEERVRYLTTWIKACCDEWTVNGGTCEGCVDDACPLTAATEVK